MSMILYLETNFSQHGLFLVKRIDVIVWYFNIEGLPFTRGPLRTVACAVVVCYELDLCCLCGRLP